MSMFISMSTSMSVRISPCPDLCMFMLMLIFTCELCCYAYFNEQLSNFQGCAKFVGNISTFNA